VFASIDEFPLTDLNNLGGAFRGRVARKQTCHHYRDGDWGHNHQLIGVILIRRIARDDFCRLIGA
jgi:hypothetical protein